MPKDVLAMPAKKANVNASRQLFSGILNAIAVTAVTHLFSRQVHAVRQNCEGHFSSSKRLQLTTKSVVLPAFGEIGKLFKSQIGKLVHIRDV